MKSFRLAVVLLGLLLTGAALGLSLSKGLQASDANLLLQVLSFNKMLSDHQLSTLLIESMPGSQKPRKPFLTLPSRQC